MPNSGSPALLMILGLRPAATTKSACEQIPTNLTAIRHAACVLSCLRLGSGKVLAGVLVAEVILAQLASFDVVDVEGRPLGTLLTLHEWQGSCATAEDQVEQAGDDARDSDQDDDTGRVDRHWRVPCWPVGRSYQVSDEPRPVQQI